jgi:glycosyltransferase involved in cell wall biosynthesis
MKIGQIAPPMESVPPRLYGGTERVVSYLTEELVNMGHDVTLFASGDSLTSANLVSCAPAALRLNDQVRDTIPYYVMMLERVRQQAHNFDILHFHIDYFHFPLFRSIARRTVTTLHGRLDLPDLPAFYSAFEGMPLVSISDARRLCRLPGPDLSRERSRTSHSDRPGFGDTPQDRRKGRQGGRGLFSRARRAFA